MIKPTNASIRQVCPACGGVRSLEGLTDMPVCRSERTCMDALLEEAMSYNPTINKENEVERRLRIAIAAKADQGTAERWQEVMTYEEQTAAEIQIGHMAIWIHASDTGECLGRFGIYGIDVHRRISEQYLGQCLDCTHSRTTSADWRRFQESMMTYHGVDLSKIGVPDFVEKIK